MNFDEYVSHDATALAGLVREGRATATELLDVALARLNEVNPALNAVVHLMEDEARRAAASTETGGAFRGVPFLAKDLISNYAGHPTSAGSRLLAGWVPKRDSELAVRVKRTGVSVLGKTNLPEWGLVPVTESELWGPCRNPWDLERTPGGSSGGSAAAVAAGIVPMAGGGDGGGSIRIPSSCCGLFGLKPSRGRVPTGPDYGLLWRGATVEHVLTRSVRDSARMLDATQGPEVGAPFDIAQPSRPYAEEVGEDPGKLRIAWTTKPSLPADVHPDCVAAVQDAVSLLTDLGHELVEDAPPIDADAFVHAFLTMVAGEMAADLRDAETLLGRKPKRSEVEPATWALGLLGQALPAVRFASALRILERTGREAGVFMNRYDLFLTPTVSCPPPLIGEIAPTSSELLQLRVIGAIGSGMLVRALGLLDEIAHTAFDFIPWTPVANATGQPAMSVPLWWNEAGLPVGVHFVAPFGAEDRLLRLAAQLEEARPWFDRRPALPG